MSTKLAQRPLTNAEAREKRQAEREGRIWRRHGLPAGRNFLRTREGQWSKVIDGEHANAVGHIRTGRHV